MANNNNEINNLAKIKHLEEELKKTKELVEDVEDSLETAVGDIDCLRSEIQEYEELNTKLVFDLKDLEIWMDIAHELRLVNNEFRSLHQDLISEGGLKDEDGLLEERCERLQKRYEELS